MKISNTKPLSSAVDYSNGRINCADLLPSNYVGTDNLLQNKGGRIDATYIPVIGATTKYNKEDILIANIRPYLKKIWYATNSGGSSADVLTLRVKDNYDSRFVYYSLFRDDFFIHMMNGSKGSKMPRGDKDQILRFLIPEFDLIRQRNIGRTLAVLDEKIALNNKINAELEAMTKTLYDYWFVQFDFPDENGKPYKSSGGKIVFNEKLKRKIPDGWDDDKIGNLLTNNSVKNKVSASNIQKKGKFPVIDQSTDYVSGFTDDENTVIKVNEPKIIFGDHTRILKLINFDFACGADGTQILVSNNLRMPQHLFFYTVSKIDLSSYGYARHFKFLKDIHIILPDKKLSIQFEEFAENNHFLIQSNNLQNQKLTEIRDRLLPMLMNGQVTVK